MNPKTALNGKTKELAAIEAELRRGLGLGGRARREKQAAERTGMRCSYGPERATRL